MNAREEKTPASRSPRRANPVYTFLTSMKVGVILLLILTAACVLGTMLPQNQPAELYLKHYGESLGGLYLRLGLTHLFSSWWFNSLAGLLGLSLLMCAWRRFKVLLRAQRPEVKVTLERLEAMKAHARFSASISGKEAERRLADWLRRDGYQVLEEDSSGATCILGRKGSLSQWGTLLVHVSLLVILLGAMYGNIPSIRGIWQTRSYSAEATLAENQRFTVRRPKAQPFAVELMKAERELSPEGMPTAFRSRVRIWEDGRPVKEGLIEMNKPVYHKGVSITMSQYFEPQAEPEADLRLLVKAPGASVQEIPIPLLGSAEGMTVDMMRTITPLPAKGWNVFAHSLFPAALEKDGRVALGENGRPREPRPGEEVVPVLSVFVVENPGKEGMRGWKPVGFVGPGREVDYKGVSFILREGLNVGKKSATGAVLSLHRDPGIPAVYLGFGLLMLGVTLAFYVSQKTVRLRLWEEKGQAKVAAGVRSRGGLAWAETELERLRAALKG